jgi:hypothetical protein
MTREVNHPLFVVACFVCILASILTACSSKPLFEKSISHQNVKRDKLWGEYLQKSPWASDQILTFVRNPLNQKDPQAGLVAFNLSSQEISVLDPEAHEGKDLQVSSRAAFYRIGDQIFYWNPKQKMLLASQIKKLLGANEDVRIQVSLERTDGVSGLLCFSEGGSVFHASAGRLVASIFAGAEASLHLTERESSLHLEQASCAKGFFASQKIEESGRVSDAKFHLSKSKIWLAYLPEEKGSLKLLSMTLQDQDLTVSQIENVAGKDYESVMGMDVAFFDDGEKPGLVFLDAQELKLWWARFHKDQWKSEKIRISGALGFYNLVIGKTDDHLRLATHAFRSIDERDEYSFEDLIITELPLGSP